MCNQSYSKLREINFDDYKERQVPIGISNRHVHVSQADLEKLFGEGYELTPKKDLSQPGQFACEECVDVVGPKGTIERVRILGPVRPETQVELAQTDARKIGVNAALRESGVLDGTEGCKLVGPKGEIELEKGCIVAHLHIHFHTDEAAKMGIKDHQVLTVLVRGQKNVLFCDVIARVGDKMKLDFHLDTDEANAALVGPGAVGIILD
ncbi:MAG TPA: phosphate propanoyltransferase [Firmicutes bacterium]|nr:phosphate propanoyltransferase [Bacillota bacterium]